MSPMGRVPIRNKRLDNGFMVFDAYFTRPLRYRAELEVILAVCRRTGTIGIISVVVKEQFLGLGQMPVSAHSSAVVQRLNTHTAC